MSMFILIANTRNSDVLHCSAFYRHQDDVYQGAAYCLFRCSHRTISVHDRKTAISGNPATQLRPYADMLTLRQHYLLLLIGSLSE
jgi:hypothetical protein